MEKLSQHTLNFNPEIQVRYEFELSNDMVIVDFEVKSPLLSIGTHFDQETYDNWKLWEYDVVEVFLSKSPNNGYLELQISPNNQKLAVLIKEPRKIYDIYPNFTGTAHSNVTNSGFNATFHVPLNEIPGRGEDIFGNLSACLGPHGKQSYFSLIEHPEGNPDFHRPDYFIKLKQRINN